MVPIPSFPHVFSSRPKKVMPHVAFLILAEDIGFPVVRVQSMRVDGVYYVVDGVLCGDTAGRRS